MCVVKGCWGFLGCPSNQRGIRGLVYDLTSICRKVEQLNPPASMQDSMFYMRARRRLPGILNTVMRYGSAHNQYNERIDINTCQDNEKGDLAKDPKIREGRNARSLSLV